MAGHVATGPVVAVSDLRKTFGRVAALDGLDVTIEAGTIFGVIGPNGAGKTTLMRILLDVIRPSGGQVRVLGEDPRVGGAALRRRIGYLPGELRLQARMSAAALLHYWGQISGPVDPTYRESLVTRLGLDTSVPVRKLSKGNKQKVGIVQALMHRPALLVLDEPTSGLDPLAQQEFRAIVQEARAAGATVLLSSHVLSEVEQIAESAVIMRRGRAVTTASIHDLRARAARHLRALVEHPDPTAVADALAGRGLGELVVTPVSPALVSVTGLVSGRTDDIVKALALWHVVDLVLAEPDLEESVLAIYGGGS